VIAGIAAAAAAAAKQSPLITDATRLGAGDVLASGHL